MPKDQYVHLIYDRVCRAVLKKLGDDEKASTDYVSSKLVGVSKDYPFTIEFQLTLIRYRLPSWQPLVAHITLELIIIDGPMPSYQRTASIADAKDGDQIAADCIITLGSDRADASRPYWSGPYIFRFWRVDALIKNIDKVIGVIFNAIFDSSIPEGNWSNHIEDKFTKMKKLSRHAVEYLGIEYDA